MLIELINSAAVKDVIISERMKVYQASFNFEISDAPQYSYFTGIINSVPQRDKLKITLEDNSERILNLLAETEESYCEFISNALVDEIITVRIRIDKEVQESHFSIYSFDEFIKDILSLSLENVMISFSNLLKCSGEYIVFDVYSPINMFATKTMFFVQDGNGVINTEVNRKQKIQNCKEVSYFYNFDRYEVIPDDFKITIDYPNNPLTEIFQKITTLLSISFISTSSSINDRQLKGAINGQRTMEYCCDIDSTTNNAQIYSIYNWIYTDGNAIDKALIARNVISLHCKYASIVDIDEKVMASIQSNYNLYLKDNVKEYLELRNRVAEFISDIVSKTGDYATEILDKFKTNIIAIFGFMFTVILANIVSSQPLDNLFTRDITILIEFVIAGSFVYLVICYLQSCYSINKVYSSYEQLKKNYDNILTEDDLNEIFDNDNLIKQMQATISKSQKIYLALWIAFLIISIIAIERLSSSPSYQIILDFINTLHI